ncbi:MAG TPA: hypothetical protein VG028_18245 [Terriglobia bacterium]|nr:hypothetical protein [Terriglobia bacterium]
MRRNRVLLVAAGITALLAGVSIPAWADHEIEKTLKLDPGGRFVLDADAGSATITGTQESGAKVTITSNRDDLESLFNFSFEDGPGTARVTARKTFHDHWMRNLSVHFEISVPTSTQLEVKTGGGSVKVFSIKGDSQLKTSGGSVEVSDLAGQLRAETSGGHILLREVTGNVRAETSGGSIEVESLSGSFIGNTSGGPIHIARVEGDVDSSTSGGSIHIEDAGGRVVAKTSGGSVEVRFDRGNDKGGELETSGGSVRAALDPKVNLNIDASASGGGVRSDLPITVVGRISTSSMRGTLGSGGAELRMHTSGGSVQIEAR